jgi:hypothetical protein
MASNAGHIYLDYNATTPLSEKVKQAIISALDAWGNPSSNSLLGKKAKEIIENARRQVAECVGADASEIIFMSGGTEVCTRSVFLSGTWIKSTVQANVFEMFLLGRLFLVCLRAYRCDNRRFWLSAHDCHVPTPTSQNLELKQQIWLFEAD